MGLSGVWQYTPIISVLGRLRQEDEDPAWLHSVGCIERPASKPKVNKQMFVRMHVWNESTSVSAQKVQFMFLGWCPWQTLLIHLSTHTYWVEAQHLQQGP